VKVNGSGVCVETGYYDEWSPELWPRCDRAGANTDKLHAAASDQIDGCVKRENILFNYKVEDHFRFPAGYAEKAGRRLP